MSLKTWIWEFGQSETIHFNGGNLETIFHSADKRKEYFVLLPVGNEQ
jgi:hypothetical protein